ncbi:non-ribosomal peptide synthetase/MFS transporter [Actinoplanes sp. DH11]|uniref:non-ribosomal peptide synthetase/MFS transporter n=1 Tax=Actinoplanes sp. DH11 TaxID=2857011 RepID=UPI001E461B21|nr:non-ribosomal peptide synthetase [Actinoplanes sp. DH11]
MSAPALAAAAPGAPAPLLSFLEHHATVRPGHPAVVEGAEVTTYADLYARAHALAARLRAAGLGRGDVVGLAAERGTGTVLAMLGILLADAAFVPLDAADPPDRLRRIAEGAGVTTVVAGPGRQAPFAAAGLTCLTPAGGSTGPEVAVPPEATGQDTAYVIHTSGTSGRPKGVAVSRAALAHFCRVDAAGYRYTPDDRVLQFVSIAFDASIEEILPPLTAGATVVIRDDAMISSVAGFLQRCADRELTVLHLPTAFWHELVDAVTRDAIPMPPRLRLVTMGGEAVRPERVAAWRALPAAAGIRVVNAYGPTETTIVCTWDELAGPDAEPEVPGQSVIGRPLPGVVTRILGPDGTDVTPGEAGELLIGGPTVAIGYVGQDELTAQRFRTLDDGVRYYRTGDRVRRLGDGRLVYLGRIDRQVKVRGFRVEPAEVERALIGHPDVRDAVVHYDGERQILLGFLLVGDATSDLAGVREHAATTLPWYAVPTTLVPVTTFPRTDRDKVDVAALAALAAPRETLGARYASEQEQALADIVKDVLGRRPAPDDVLPDLGLHSLAAVQVLSRLQRRFGVRITVADLYAHPTVASLATLVPAVPVPAGVTGEVTASGPPALTDFQRDAWLGEQLLPGTPMNTLGIRYRITGAGGPDEIVAAVRHLPQRHDALRARVLDGDTGPVLAGGDVPAVPVEVHDLSGLAPADRAARAERLAGERGRTVFDLARGPLLAATVLATGPGECELVLAVHHAVFDGWSAAVVAEDLAALLAGDELPVAASYAGHLHAEQALAGSPERDRLHAHWARRLRGMDTGVELPADRARPAVRSFAGAKLARALPGDLLTGVRELAAENGSTPYAVVLAAVQTLIRRQTGHTDITVLSPVAHRTDPERESTVGAFITVLPMRTDLAGDPDFRTVLHRATGTARDALSHDDLPLGAIVRAAGVPPRADRSPLTQIMLIVQNTPPARATRGPVTVSHVGDTHPGMTKLDLTITVDLVRETPELTAEYATELFERVTVERLLDQLVCLLQAAVTNPGTAIDRLDVLPAPQRRELLGAPEPAPEPGAEPAPVVQHAVRDRAVVAPAAAAVTCGTGTWSYGELDATANRIAAALTAGGAGTGDRVGICLPRGPLAIAAVLGVWRAGAAFVPLDPDYPAGRLAHMIGDSAARVVLTGGGDTPALPESTATLDCTALPDAPPPPDDAVGGDRPAYVLYTSGTTGQPKGVVVTHGNLRAAAAMWRTAYELTSTDVHLQAASFSFDVFVGETVRALSTGAHLVVCPRETLLDPAALRTLLDEHRVTVAELVPAVLRRLVEHCEAAGAGLPGLRLLAGGADRWYVHEYRRARALLGPHARVVNSYGVTEATVDNAYFDGPADDLPPGAALPIGRPYPGNRLYVLDAHGEPVPYGVTGELWIGGPGVAAGYHRRPELTAQRFRPDPFTDVPHARMYRTGDTVRRRADGVLEFLGRADDQVKINGHRIELGEVETALAALPGVRAAAVAVRADRAGTARLAGYVVPDGSADPPDLERLRRRLHDALPHYAVPAALVALPALPMSPNGKLDRAALPAPPQTTAAAAGDEPRTELQRRLAEVWAAELGVGTVALDDDFFALGGDSFTALRLVRALEPVTGARVALLDLYRTATVRRLAEHLTAPPDPDAAGGRLLHRLTPERAAPAATLVCVPYSGGGAIAFEPLASALPADWALYALQSPGHDASRPDEPLLPGAEIVRRCLDELAAVPGPLYLYGHCHGSAIAVELARRLEESGRDVAGLVIGAGFPVARLPGRIFDWAYRKLPVNRLVSDREYLEFLRARGGFTDVADEPEQAWVLRAVRHDVRDTEEYFTRTLQEDLPPLRAPILSVVGDRDRVTELYPERFREWEHFGPDVSLAVLPKAGHFFLKHQAAELAQHIVRWAGGADPEPVPAAPSAAPTGPAGPQPSLGRFAAVAAGQFVSMVGSSLSQLVLSLWVYQQTGRITDFAFVTAVALLPGILAGPLAGAVADRYDRRLVMLASDGAAGLSTIALIALLSGGDLRMWHVYLLCALTSLATAFQRPAYLAAMAQLVPKPFLGHATGIGQLGVGAGALFAPMLVAGLLGVLSTPQLLLVDAATFAVAAVTLLLVRFPDRLFRRREETVGAQIRNGWRYVARRPGLTAALRFFVVDHLIYTIGFALITPLILIEHDVATLGLVLTAGGVGALVGGLVMSVWGGTRRRATGMIAFMGVSSLALTAVGLTSEPWLMMAGMFGLSATESLINGHWIALVQTKVGLELQGRVLAIFITAMNLTMPIGYVLVGPLADRLFRDALQPGAPLAGTAGAVLGTGPGRGLALVVVVSGVLLIGWTLRGWYNPRLRLLEDVLPDAVPDAEIGTRDELQRQADARLTAA